MSHLERLHGIIDALPPEQVRALLTLLNSSDPVSDDEFYRRLAEAPEEDADGEIAARVLAAEAESGDAIPHEELKRRLWL